MGCWPAAERSLKATEAFGRFKGPESGPSASGTSDVAVRTCQSMAAPPIPTVSGDSALVICVQDLRWFNISMRRNCWPYPKPPQPVLGKGTILARYVPPWLRSTTTSSCPYDGVVFLWTSFDRAPSASPLQEEGGRVALLRLSFQLPRAACAVSAIVRAAPTHPVHENVWFMSRGYMARGSA